MYLYHPTFLITALNVVIISLLAFVGYVTSNPLVVLGLLLLQQAPVIDPSSLIAAEEPIYDEEDDEVTHDSGDHRMGFLAKIEDKSAA